MCAISYAQADDVLIYNSNPWCRRKVTNLNSEQISKIVSWLNECSSHHIIYEQYFHVVLNTCTLILRFESPSDLAVWDLSQS